jgi:hypothetical protein
MLGGFDARGPQAAEEIEHERKVAMIRAHHQQRLGATGCVLSSDPDQSFRGCHDRIFVGEKREEVRVSVLLDPLEPLFSGHAFPEWSVRGRVHRERHGGCHCKALAFPPSSLTTILVVVPMVDLVDDEGAPASVRVLEYDVDVLTR